MAQGISKKMGFPGVSVGKESPAMQETWVQSLGREDPWRREWQPTPVFLPGEFHGQKSLVSYSPWSCKELDMTEQPILQHFFFQDGESMEMLSRKMA